MLIREKATGRELNVNPVKGKNLIIKGTWEQVKLTTKPAIKEQEEPKEEAKKLDELSVKELQELANGLEGFKKKMKKAQLIELIEGAK